MQNTENMVLERLNAWSAYHNDALSDSIHCYRDEVSEGTCFAPRVAFRLTVCAGQYMKVKDVEIVAIHRTFSSLAERMTRGRKPVKLAAVVAARRHHTPFYPIDKKDMEGRAKNFRPGTLVGTTVTSPFFADFLLQSHSGPQRHKDRLDNNPGHESLGDTMFWM
jgi:eukaryotic translation initiation factor 2C